jgi:hypothetical protein
MDESGATVCECCWNIIVGESYTIDDVTMCESCLVYHYGDDVN